MTNIQLNRIIRAITKACSHDIINKYTATEDGDKIRVDSDTSDLFIIQEIIDIVRKVCDYENVVYGTRIIYCVVKDVVTEKLFIHIS